MCGGHERRRRCRDRTTTLRRIDREARLRPRVGAGTRPPAARRDDLRRPDRPAPRRPRGPARRPVSGGRRRGRVDSPLDGPRVGPPGGWLPPTSRRTSSRSSPIPVSRSAGTTWSATTSMSPPTTSSRPGWSSNTFPSAANPEANGGGLAPGGILVEEELGCGSLATAPGPNSAFFERCLPPLFGLIERFGYDPQFGRRLPTALRTAVSAASAPRASSPSGCSARPPPRCGGSPSNGSGAP